MVAACGTALARAGGGGRGVGRDSERAAHGETGVSGRRGALSSTGGALKPQRRLGSGDLR